MKRRLKHSMQWVAKRGAILIASSLIGAVGLLLLLLITSTSQSNTNITIAIAAFSSFLAGISAFASLSQVIEVQKQRENQERPYVIVYFEVSSRNAIYFFIQNSGNSPAIDIRVEFKPVPVDFAGRPLNQVPIFQKPISFLPSGKFHRQILNVSSKFLADDMPSNYIIKVTYSSVFKELFEEVTEFDLAYLKLSTLPGKSIEDNLEDISKQLGDLYGLLKSAKGIDSLLVESPEQYQKRMNKLAKGIERPIKEAKHKNNKSQ